MELYDVENPGEHLKDDDESRSILEVEIAIMAMRIKLLEKALWNLLDLHQHDSENPVVKSAWETLKEKI